MTIEKCREVLARYEQAVTQKNFYPTEYAHLSSMLPQMREMLDAMAANGGAALVDQPKREKFMRWLGFMQGAFWMMGVYSIEQMKAHNRPDFQIDQAWVTKVTSEDEP